MEPQLITGIADFVQIHMRYSFSPALNLVVFNFKVINITKFLLEQLSLELQTSLNIKVKPFPNQSNIF